MNLPPSPFAAWANYRRWVNWVAIPDPDKPGKMIKRPIDSQSGLFCKATDPTHQYSFNEAAEASTRELWRRAPGAVGGGIGFVFNRVDGFWFLDADGALQADGNWSQLVDDLWKSLTGCAVEVSSSGTGLHAFGFGRVPPHACKNVSKGLELYTHDRFVALTFTQASGSVMHDAPAIADIAARFFPPNPVNDFAGWTVEAEPEYGGPADDDNLIAAALKSGKRGIGAAFDERHVTFEDLWTRNVEALAKRWPGSTDGFDASQADGALAAHLAYWTGKNCERTKALMLRSGLVRDKWERESYIEPTILRATATVTNIAKGLVDREAAKEMGVPTGLEGVTFDGDAPTAPPRELIKGLLPADGIAFLGGQSGAGKTYIAVALAVALAAPHDQ